MESSFGLDLLLESIDDRLNGTSFQAKELRKLLLWLTLACWHLATISNKSRLIDREGKKFLSKVLKNGCGLTELWVWPQIFHVLFAHIIVIEPPS